VTRLRLTTATQRLVVGYDPDLTTYYIETGPATPASKPEEDPDEGLSAARGRRSLTRFSGHIGWGDHAAVAAVL